MFAKPVFDDTLQVECLVYMFLVCMYDYGQRLV